MRRTLRLLTVVLCSGTAVWGQGIKKDDFVRDDTGAAISGALVRVCPTDTLCFSGHEVTIYSDRDLTRIIHEIAAISKSLGKCASEARSACEAFDRLSLFGAPCD